MDACPCTCATPRVVVWGRASRAGIHSQKSSFFFCKKWSHEEGRRGRAFILKSLFSFFARRGRMRKGVAGGHPFSKVIHILRRFFCFFCVTCGRMRKGVTGGHRFSKVLHVMGTYRLKKKSYTKIHRVKLGGHWLLRICVRFSRSCCHKDIIVNKGKYSATVAVIISYVNNNILGK